MTTLPRPAAELPHPAHWLGYSALSGWLTGPLLTAGYWLVSGDAEDGQLSFSPSSGLLPLAGLLAVWAAFVGMTHGSLGTGWRIAARRATVVLGLGSVGWLLAQVLRMPDAASIDELALEWAALTLPYPAVAAAVYRRATRPVATEAAAPRTNPGRVWTRRYRTHAIGAACLVLLVLGLAIESVGSGQARAADLPVRSANAEPEAPDGMLLLVAAARRYKPTSYDYVRNAATTSYTGQNTPTSAYDNNDNTLYIGSYGGCCFAPLNAEDNVPLTGRVNAEP